LSGAEPSRRLAAWTTLAVAVAAAAAWIAHVRFGAAITRPIAGPHVSSIGLAIQLAAVAAGVWAINTSRDPATARRVLAAEGAVCLLAWGVRGLGCALGLVAWWAVLELRCLGRARFLLVAALVVAINATAWLAPELAAIGLLFSVTFALRLFVFTYDRWQQAREPTPPLDLLAYLLLPPLVIIAPYMAVIPLFGGFSAKLRPGLTVERLRRVGKHLALAAAFGALRYAMHLVDGGRADPMMYWKLVRTLLDFATLAHACLGLLLLHGVDERPPLDRPLLATRFVELWQRFGSHLKDAQVFLFYVPALLRLRRMNRYLAIVLATLFTMVVGNTLLHVAALYCFRPDTRELIGRALIANSIMAIALAVDLCRDEWWQRRGGPPPRTPLQLAIGWSVTMTIAATVSSI
jgi:hypothetical protein